MDGFSYFYNLSMLFKTAVAASDVDVQFRGALELMHHPRMKLVRNIPYQGFTISNKPEGPDIHLDGLTGQLEALFYPCSKRVMTGGGKSGGASRGNTVSAELDKLINLGILPEGGMHKYTLKTLQYLQDHRLQPFAAELVVFDEKIQIATPVDLVCVDLACKDFEKNVVLLELKTGFPMNYETSSGFFHSPFVPDSSLLATTDSYKNKHQLQALLEHLIVCKNYTRKVRETRVVVISENMHSSYGLCPHIRAIAHDVYKNLHKRLEVRHADPDYAIDLRHDVEKKVHKAGRVKKFAK